MMAEVDLTGGLERAWENVVLFAPKLLGFFLILLIGYLVAKAVSKLVDGLLERVGFDRWVEGGAGSVGAAFQRSNTEPSDVIGVIAFWGIFLVALQLAFGIWGPNPISDLIQGVLAYLPNVIAAVIILVIAGAIAKVVTDVLTPTLGAVAGGSWIARIAGASILVVGVFAALDQLRIAPAIVTGLFYALLVAIVGTTVVAFGGGGIPVAREYLSRWSTRAQLKAEEIKANADPDDPDAGRQRAEEMRETVGAQDEVTQRII